MIILLNKYLIKGANYVLVVEEILRRLVKETMLLISYKNLNVDKFGH